jgi:putative glutamine amidotransferase
MKQRPVIGVTGPDRGGFPAWICTWLAIHRAGGQAVRLRPSRYQEEEKPLPHLDGLVLGGGADVDPGRYDGPMIPPEDPKELEQSQDKKELRWSRFLAPILFVWRRLFSLSASEVDPDRDHFETRCLDSALASGIPVLGICRGAQFLNVHLGGTLHRDIRGFYGEVGQIDTVHPRKPILIEPESLLHRLLNVQDCWVNSLHNQAVDRLGSDLIVSARDRAGVIQAIEHTDHPFLLGVQWHPEYLPSVRVQQRLFKQLLIHIGNSPTNRQEPNEISLDPLRCIEKR